MEKEENNQWMIEIWKYLPENVKETYTYERSGNIYFILKNNKKIKLSKKELNFYFKLRDLLIEKLQKIEKINKHYNLKIEKYEEMLNGEKLYR